MEGGGGFDRGRFFIHFMPGFQPAYTVQNRSEDSIGFSMAKRLGRLPL